MNQPNPYAAPSAAASAPVSAVFRTTAPAAAVQAALHALHAYLANPLAAVGDQERIGPRLRRATKLSLGGSALAALLILAWLAIEDISVLPHALAIGLPPGIVLLIAGAVLLFQDLKLVPRAQATDPTVALRSFLNALRFGRTGYAAVCLAPGARTQTVSAPPLDPVVTGGGTFDLETEKGLLQYAQSFARAGYGQMRWSKIKQMRVVSQDEYVAEVEVEAWFQSVPRWAYITSLVLLVLTRGLGFVIGAVLFFALRKRTTVRFTKIMLRGPDHLWYVYDANLLEQMPRY
jgi:hypothetical protein